MAAAVAAMESTLVRIRSMNSRFIGPYMKPAMSEAVRRATIKKRVKTLVRNRMAGFRVRIHVNGRKKTSKSDILPPVDVACDWRSGVLTHRSLPVRGNANPNRRRGLLPPHGEPPRRPAGLTRLHGRWR